MPSPSRRAPIVALSLLALLAVAAWVWRAWPAPPAPPVAHIDPAAERDLLQKMLQQVKEREAGGGGTRTEVALPPPDAPRVRVQVVDATTAQPLPGAMALDVARAESLGAADANGELTTPVLPPGRLAFAKDGYLTRLVVPDGEIAQALAQPGSVAKVALTKDTFTLPMTVRFVSGDAVFGGDVRFTVRCLDAVPPSGGSFPTGRLAPGEQVQATLVEAWREHTLVSQLPGLADETLHLGLLGHLRTFEARAGQPALVRVIASGRYRIDAVATKPALAGRADVAVDVGREGPFEVVLTPGRMVQGSVVDATSSAGIAGARVRLAAADGAAGEVETDAMGVFTLGPVPGELANIEVAARCYVDLATSVPVGRDVKVPLTRRPTRVVRGIVRARPTLVPLADIPVEIRVLGEVDASTRTRADGTFDLQTCADTAQLTIRAPGYLPWVEMLYDPVPSYVCDLLPVTADARLAVGLVARVSGRVLRADGSPAAGLPVQLFSDESHLPEGLAGRAILEGYVIPVMPVAIAGADGSFTLEWPHAGPVKLVPTDGTSTAADAVVVNLALGQHARDITLRAR